jgi:glutamate formiminotransferase/formiminotetrahydrofolate cyclodeaminase
MSLALRAAQIGNLNAITDAASGAAMARAALTASGYNVRINLASLKDESQKAERLQTLRTLEARADELDSALREILSTRGGFSI